MVFLLGPCHVRSHWIRSSRIVYCSLYLDRKAEHLHPEGAFWNGVNHSAIRGTEEESRTAIKVY
jgi:hypothetical protein